jgi:hypothetical protein
MRPRVNLEFFDEKYFDELFWKSFVEFLIEELPKIKFKGRKETILKAKEALWKIAEKAEIPQDVIESLLELGKMVSLEHKKKGE